MAAETNKKLRDSIIYSVYVRNHSEEGTFKAVIADLNRIKALGTDIVWFMPIHPIGVKGKKGSLGCPYANRDYRSTNPEYGSLEDFKLLTDEIHKRGMKCMIDVVYNHTSPDSVLTEQHPEFFYRKSDGNMGNQVGDWTDVVDLDYHCPELWDYQIESLKMWAGIVDGFRCDVASFLPVEFWRRAREAVEEIRPGCIWLAETVHSSFGQFIRKSGMYCARDTDMFKAFDMEYEYDVREVFDRYLAGSCALSNYIDVLNFQECAYPENYIKLRFLENHDQPRICSFVKDAAELENYSAFLFFLKGATLIYAGQEYRNEHVPSLFDKDVFERNGELDISPLLTKLAELKKRELSAEDHFCGWADDENHIAVLKRDDGQRYKLGIFSLKARNAWVNTALADGEYENLIDGEKICVEGGRVFCSGKPIIISVESSKAPQWNE